MTKHIPEQIALNPRLDALIAAVPLTAADYGADGNLTNEAVARIFEQVVPQLSAAEKDKLAQDGLMALVEQTMDTMVEEGKAERFTDEHGEIRFRMMHAS